MTKTTIHGTVEGGRFDAMAKFNRCLLSYKGLVNVIIEPYKKPRSNAQNSLMWVAHLDAAVKVFESYGNELTRPQVHEQLKEMFLPDEGHIPIIVDGEVVGINLSTKNLSLDEGMPTYLKRLEVFCAENHFPVATKD